MAVGPLLLGVWLGTAPRHASAQEAAPSSPPLAAPPPVPVVSAPVEVAPVEVAPSKWPSYALWGASGAAFVLATYYGVTALKAKNDFEDAPSFKLADRAEDRATVCDISIGVGISFALIGTLLYFTGDEETPRDARRVSIAPVMQARSGGAALMGRF